MFCCWPLTPLHSLRPVMRGNDWRKKEAAVGGKEEEDARGFVCESSLWNGSLCSTSLVYNFLQQTLWLQGASGCCCGGFIKVAWLLEKSYQTVISLLLFQVIACENSNLQGSLVCDGLHKSLRAWINYWVLIKLFWWYMLITAKIKLIFSF